MVPCRKDIREPATLIKKKIKFSSYMGKYFLLSSYIRKPFLIYYFATAPL